MGLTIEQSYDHCVALARKAARNFYYGFLLLPKQKRRAVCALYAFMRRVDDVADETVNGDRHRWLSQWQASLDPGADADSPDDPLMPAIRDALARYSLPRSLLDEVIEGVRMDLERARYQTSDDLALYCHRVAGVVGSLCIRIWGVRDLAEADPLADRCGEGFQLTNVLRDVREDAQRGRIYVPLEYLNRSGISEDEWLRCTPDARSEDVVALLAERARSRFSEAEPLAAMIDADSRACFLAMFGIYSGLLDRIAAEPRAVFVRRVRLGNGEKLRIVLRALRQAREIGRSETR